MQDVAERLGREAKQMLLSPAVMPMDAYDVAQLPRECLLLCVASTTGQVGTIPQTTCLQRPSRCPVFGRPFLLLLGAACKLCHSTPFHESVGWISSWMHPCPVGRCTLTTVQGTLRNLGPSSMLAACLLSTCHVWSMLPGTLQPVTAITCDWQGVKPFHAACAQGDPPENMKRFWRFMLRKGLSADSLSAVQFSVFGLGDSNYPKYNVSGCTPGTLPAAARVQCRLQDRIPGDLTPGGVTHMQQSKRAIAFT